MPRISEMNEKIEGAFAFSYRWKIGKLLFTNTAESVAPTPSRWVTNTGLGTAMLSADFRPGIE